MNKIRVCLDAGHIGSTYNQSPVVGTCYESAMVWALHVKLRAALEARGFEVVTTRATIDTPMDVYARGTAAKGCDVFLSLHSNACDTESVDYPVVYRAYDNLNNADTLALGIAKMIGALMGTRQTGRTATRKNSAGNEYYGVLRGARAVGVPLYLLLEHSFHTNTAAARWLSIDSNLRKLAEAEADLLAAYFKVTAQATEPAVPDWQREGLRKLADAGVIKAPVFWSEKLAQTLTVGELFGILGNLLTAVRKAEALD